jgi:hypothetical protein
VQAIYFLRLERVIYFYPAKLSGKPLQPLNKHRYTGLPSGRHILQAPAINDAVFLFRQLNEKGDT